MGDRVGGRFRVFAVIGSGAVAHVLAAVDELSGRTAAVKVPRRPGDAAHLRREAELLARVASPHLPELLASDFSDEESAFVALERLAPPPFSDGERVPWEHASAIVGECARALAALHKAGVVHCDVKPGNLMMRGERVVLIDFNAALAVGASTGGQFAGSAPYMAPELWRGEPVAAATDVYALAATAIALATGAPPFEVAGTPAQMRAHLEDAPPSLASRGVGVAPSVEEAIARALAKAIDARPSDVEAFARAVQP